MKIGIVGSRTRDTPNDHVKLYNAVNKKISEYGEYQYGDVWLVSGGQKKGADGWAESFAKANGFPMLSFNPDWDKLDRSAGPIRNVFIARWSDVLIAALSPDSVGTKDTIDKFKNLHPTRELILI